MSDCSDEFCGFQFPIYCLGRARGEEKPILMEPVRAVVTITVREMKDIFFGVKYPYNCGGHGERCSAAKEKSPLLPTTACVYSLDIPYFTDLIRMAVNIDAAKIQEWRALCEDLMPCACCENIATRYSAVRGVCVCEEHAFDADRINHEFDAGLITFAIEARTALPALLDEVERLREGWRISEMGVTMNGCAADVQGRENEALRARVAELETDGREYWQYRHGKATDYIAELEAALRRVLEEGTGVVLAQVRRRGGGMLRATAALRDLIGPAICAELEKGAQG